MKELEGKPEIVIPATEEATDQYRLDQSAETMKEEKAQTIEFAKGKPSIFKRGRVLDRTRSMAPAMGDWAPAGEANLRELIPQSLLDKVERDLSFKGVAGTIALTDTAAGVRETITYDENEQIVLDFLNGEEDQ